MWANVAKKRRTFRLEARTRCICCLRLCLSNLQFRFLRTLATVQGLVGLAFAYLKVLLLFLLFLRARSHDACLPAVEVFSPENIAIIELREKHE